MRDAIELEWAGIPSVVIVADALLAPAEAMCRISGLRDYRLGVTPFPVGNLTLAELDDRARALGPEVVEMLTEGRRSGRPAEAEPGAEGSWRRYTDEAEALADLHAGGWTDGLPVVVPTRERVAAFLATLAAPTGPAGSPEVPGPAGADAADARDGAVDPADADEVVVAVPSRGGLRATVRDVASAAVMAGCRPEELDVVLAALRAANHPRYNLHAHTGTMAGAAQVLVVNGPIRHELGLATGNGCLGPGWRPNAAIGRAVRLVIRNQLGSRPGVFDRAAFSTPARVGWCIAEAEEESPFPPLALRTAGLSGSAVTVYATTWQASVISHVRSADELLDELALAVRTACHTNWLHHDAASDSSFHATRPFLFVTGHEHARVLTDGGYGEVSRLQEALFDRLVRPDDPLRPVAVAEPACLHPVYVHATGMQQTWFLAPFASHALVTEPVRDSGAGAGGRRPN